VSIVTYVELTNSLELEKWRNNFSEYNIRYYWKDNTYFDIMLGGNVVGVCGLHKLNKNNSFLMRGTYILDCFRGKRVDLDGFSIHQLSIDYRIDQAKTRGASEIWVRCNRNSIKNYEAKGFKKFCVVERQFTPLCLTMKSS